MLANIQIRNKASIDKLASVQEEMKKIKAKAKVIRAQRVEGVAKKLKL